MKIRWQAATIAAQAAAGPVHQAGGVVSPIELSTTFARDEAYALRDADIYRRDDNATVREAEGVIAALEGASEARLFASGLAAIAATLRAADGPILLQRGLYYGTGVLAERLRAQGLSVATADMGDRRAVEDAVANERPALVFIETPSNPWLQVIDIEEIAAIAHGAGARLAVDSTAATPILTRPLALSADVVIHSATKALNGHSDVLAGAAAVADASLPLWSRVKAIRHDEGATLSPFDAYLLTRGMRTLAVRVAAMSRSTLHIASWLAAHPAVETVRYPGLDGPHHALARRQMDGGFGHLLSFDVAGGAPAALAVAGRLSLIRRATSLGGVESLIEHRHSIEPPTSGVPEGLLRLSVGLEAVDDLIADLSHALSAIA